MPASTRDAPFSCAASENDQNRRVITPYGAPLVIANVKVVAFDQQRVAVELV